MSAPVPLLRWPAYLAATIILAIVWQLAGDHSNTLRLLIATPSRTFSYAIANHSRLAMDAWTTGLESLCGLILAILISISLMIVCLYSPRLLSWFIPPLVLSQIIPLITLAPLLILLFGIGVWAKIVMAALLSFFPTFIAFARGVTSLDAGPHDLARLYGASRTFQIFRLFFPLAMPSLLTGARVSATLAVIGAIVGEFNGAENGLGRNLYLAAKRLEPEMTVCSVALSALIGAALYCAVLAAERLLVPWCPPSRSGLHV